MRRKSKTTAEKSARRLIDKRKAEIAQISEEPVEGPPVRKTRKGFENITSDTIEVTSSMGGTQWHVYNPYADLDSPDRHIVTHSRTEAAEVQRKLVKKYNVPQELSGMGNKRGRKADPDALSKTNIIKHLADDGFGYKEVAERVGCRYQMAYNIMNKYWKAEPDKKKLHEENHAKYANTRSEEPDTIQSTDLEVPPDGDTPSG